jgi:hypothetical protein
MCTVTWVHEDDGYHLLCNRDEKKTRAPASGPRLALCDGVQYVAPVDGEAGGAWIGSNAFGVSVCLLNGVSLSGDEGRITPGRRHTSRGLLLPKLMAGESVEEVCDRVWRSDLDAFAPFTLAVIEPDRNAAVVEWTGSA